MLAPDPCYSANSALFAPAMQAASPDHAHAPRGAACDGLRCRSTVTDRAQSAQQSGAVRLNSGWSPNTDHLLTPLIADAMRQLPFEQRAVIYRAYYQRWTTARIAADLKITDADVKSLLHDGLHALRCSI